jgi:hypothetical protein
MLSHGNLTSAVSIYDVWGRPERLKRNAIERVICVLPLFHIFALTVVMLSSLRRGNLVSLHQRFDVEAVMRDIEVKRATIFPGVPRCGSPSPRCPISTSAISRRCAAPARAARRCRWKSQGFLSARSA